ncbi:hypothetical protein [Pseudomonas koreensis]|uniref:hypothetical protein n=1 Tax=Pseudomonas koreensis TaxID=198620 RepID=UPI002FC9147F
MSLLKEIYPTATQLCDVPLLDLSQSVLQVLGSKLQRPQDAECTQNFLSGVRDDYDQNELAALECSEAWCWLIASASFVIILVMTPNGCPLQDRGESTVRKAYR